MSQESYGYKDTIKRRIHKIIFYAIFIVFFSTKTTLLSAQEEETDAESSSLDVITVQAPRPDWERILSPGAVTVVEPDRFKGEQKNLAEFLDAVPGLFVHRVTGAGQYTTVRMRGSTSAQVNVYVDGVLQNLGNDAAVDISLIPVSQVARIEVYRGYVPVRFSGAPIGGVINIVTRKADTLGVSVEAGVASLGGQRYNLTATTPTFWSGSLLLGAHYDQSENNFKFHSLDAVGVEHIENRRKYNDYANADFLAKWQNDNFSLKAGYKITNRSLPDPATYNYVRLNNAYFKTQGIEQTDLVAGYRNVINNLDFGVQLYYLNQDKRVDTNNNLCYPVPTLMECSYYPTWPGTIWEYRETTKIGAQVDASYKLGNNLIEIYGDYSKEHLVVNANDWVLLSTYPQNPPLIDITKRFYPEFYEKRYHLQIQDTIKFGHKNPTKLTMVYKFDKVESTGNNQGDDSWRPSWGVAVVHDADENLSFRASFGSFARYPNFAERFGDGLYIATTYWTYNKQKEVGWETGEQWDMGVDWRGSFLGAGGRASLSYFNRHTENMIVMYTTRVTSYFANAGHATVDGFEFETYLSWPRLDVDVSATWQRGKMNYAHRYQGYADTGLDNLLSNVPAWQYHLRGNYRLPGDAVNVYAEYHFTDALSKAYEESVQLPNLTAVRGDVFDEPIDSFNVGLRWQVNPALALVAGVNDLLDAAAKQGQYLVAVEDGNKYPWRRPAEYPGPGRTYFATLRYEFGGHLSVADGPTAPAEDFGDEAPGEDGSFYLSTKAVYSKLHTILSGDNMTFGGGPNGTHYYQNNMTNLPTMKRHWFAPGKGFTQPVYGGENGTSGVAGGLAFGFDLHKLHGIPVRVEIEGNLHSRRNIEYPERRIAFVDVSISTNHQREALNYIYTKQNLQIRMSTVLLNAYFDLHNSTRFTPYFGGGAGLMKYNYKVTQDVDFHYGKASTPSPDNIGQYTPVVHGYNAGYRPRYDKSTKGWDFVWNLSAGFSYQLSPVTYIDFSYRYMDYGKQEIEGTLPEEILKFGNNAANGGGKVMAYASSSGQTIDMTAHQAVLTMRFDLGAGQNAVAEYERKKAGGLDLLSGLSGPGLLDGPAVKPGSFTISPHIGLFYPDKGIGLKDGYVAGLGLGYNIDGRWGVEATVDMTSHLIDASPGEQYTGKARVGSVRLNAVRHLSDPENELSRLVPYATAGIGLVWSKGNFANNTITVNSKPYLGNKPTGDYSSFAVNAGLGVKYFLHPNAAVRLEALDTYALKDADFQINGGPYHNFAVTGGFSFQFGGR
jgi:outer membrane cobalamin receptor/opacity protein-like surface antigen